MNILESLMLALVGLLSLLILAYQYLLPADTHLLLPYLIITFASIPQLKCTGTLQIIPLQ